jgi:hypothetical protein
LLTPGLSISETNIDYPFSGNALSEKVYSPSPVPRRDDSNELIELLSERNEDPAVGMPESLMLRIKMTSDRDTSITGTIGSDKMLLIQNIVYYFKQITLGILVASLLES